MSKRSIRRYRRRGNVLVLTAVMMVVLVGLAGFAIDVGCLEVARTQLQTSADAAALAGAWELINQNPSTAASVATQLSSARQQAATFAGYNTVYTSPPTVDQNPSNLSTGDVVIGYLSNISDPASSMTFLNPSSYNSVQVAVRRTAAENGEVALFFAKVFGFNSQAMQAQATAALIKDVGGLRAASDGSNLGLLPFALDSETWTAMLAGSAPDSWSWNPATKQVQAGNDGLLEVNLYPQGTGSPGNRGTVKVGTSNNSTSTIVDQILNGITPQQMAQYPNGQLSFDANGELFLGANPGISAGFKSALAAIIGQTRIIPIFSSVSGNGNNAQYTIVELAGIRVLDVDLTGSPSSKHLTIQPATVVTGGLIQGNNPGESYYLYSLPRLVR